MAPAVVRKPHVRFYCSCITFCARADPSFRRLAVHSGRIIGKSFIGGAFLGSMFCFTKVKLMRLQCTGLRSTLPLVEPSHPNYAFSANERTP